MNRKTNIRNIEVKPGSGKNVDDTQMLKGEAKMTAAQNATNTLKEYTTGTASPGKLGGLPSRT